MKKTILITSLLLLLCSSSVLAQTTASERADQLADQVNQVGLLQTIQDSDLSYLDVQLLSLMSGLDLEGKEEALEILNPYLQEFPEFDFSLTGNSQLQSRAVHSTSVAMQQFRDAELHRRGMLPLKTGLLPQKGSRYRSVSSGSPTKLPVNIYNRKYSVWVANLTDLFLDEIVIFYQTYNSGYVYSEHRENVHPGHTRVFELRNCALFKHYAMGVFYENQLLVRVPPPGQNMTPEMVSEIHPWDHDRCLDSWAFSAN